ncbi:hypothetical protein M9H77_00826 [Catharanthus roseus]|uniref:Uncharacterized protein n=1 Tax=Catharanthus roseus TaxID=4058 RepID=A0ACC0C3X8_CATRO|nr:hypothetical protein M9H77_00826 [Catharanthus roseus]
MALSAPPPPPDPPSATTTTASTANTTAATNTATTTRPLFPPNPRPPSAHPHPNNTAHPYTCPAPFYSNHHPLPVNSRLPTNPNPNYAHLVPSPHPHDVGATSTSAAAAAILYPVASSGRGFLTKQTTPVTLANPGPNSPLFQSRPGMSYPRPPFGYSHSDPSLVQGMGYVTGRPTHVHHGATMGNSAGAAGVMPGVIKGVPVSVASSHTQHKITISPNSNSDCNGHKDLRDRTKDESAFATIRDRKVRISDNVSLYALCRSWLRNGLPEESQNSHIPYKILLHYEDGGGSSVVGRTRPWIAECVFLAGCARLGIFLGPGRMVLPFFSNNKSAIYVGNDDMVDISEFDLSGLVLGDRVESSNSLAPVINVSEKY